MIDRFILADIEVLCALDLVHHLGPNIATESDSSFNSLGLVLLPIIGFIIRRSKIKKNL